MADVIHTREVHDVDSDRGPNSSAIALVVLVVLLLLLGAWWLFWSGASPFRETTIITPETEQTTPQNQVVPVVPNQGGTESNTNQSETDINVAPGAGTESTTTP